MTWQLMARRWTWVMRLCIASFTFDLVVSLQHTIQGDYGPNLWVFLGCAGVQVFCIAFAHRHRAKCLAHARYQAHLERILADGETA